MMLSVEERCCWRIDELPGSHQAVTAISNGAMLTRIGVLWRTLRDQCWISRDC